MQKQARPRLHITAHIYDGANVVADIADTTTTFIRGNSLELLKPQSGTASLYINSPRGDTTKLINSDGTYTQYEYSAFGTEVTGNNIADNPFEYCGEYYDDESGLIYLRNRYYDPEIGRFINEDPIEDGLNWYVYCANNPVNFVDPLGLYYLEKSSDGRVYAIIEQGDTLSGIAKDQVNDANAYKNMNYSGDPNSIYPGQKIEITGIYNEQYPISNVLPDNITIVGDIKGIYYKTICYFESDLKKLNTDDYYIEGLHTLVITSKNAVETAKEIENDYIFSLVTAVAATKPDIKQIDQIAKKWV